MLEAAYNLHGSRLRGSTAFFDLNLLGGAKSLVRILENSERWAKMKRIRDRRAAAKPGTGNEDGASSNG